MKRRGFALRQGCFHTEYAFVLSFSSCRHPKLSSPCVSDQSIEPLFNPGWAQMPTATGNTLGFPITSSCWLRRVQTPKDHVYHMLHHASILEYQKVHNSFPSPTRGGQIPHSPVDIYNVHTSIIHLEISTALQLLPHLLVMLLFFYKYF